MRPLVMVLVLLTAGCATITGNRVFESRYGQIQKGVSTIQDVVALLGNPNQVIHQDAKFTELIYEKRKTYTKNWFLGKRKIDTQRLTVFFNADDVVSDYKMDSMTDDYVVEGGGGGVYNSYQPTQPNYSNSFNTGAYHY